MINKFFTVSYFTPFGLRMYLSNVGYNMAIGKGMIFEPEVRNAQKFGTQAEAERSAEAAEPVFNGKMIVQKHTIKADGRVEIVVL